MKYLVSKGACQGAFWKFSKLFLEQKRFYLWFDFWKFCKKYQKVLDILVNWNTDCYEAILTYLFNQRDNKKKNFKVNTEGYKTVNENIAFFHIEKTQFSHIIKDLIKTTWNTKNSFGKTKSLLSRQITQKVKKNISQSREDQ